MRGQIEKRNMGFSSGRELGLGAAPQDMQKIASSGLGKALGAGPESMLQCGFTQVPVIEYVTWTVQLPLRDVDIAATFGDEIDILGQTTSVAGVASVDSSFVANNTLQVDMLLIGFGIHIFGEPFSFTTIGNAIPTTATTPIWSLDAWTENDLADSVLFDATVTTYGTPAPAILEWGFPCWEAGWNLANAYQFQWKMRQRYLVINEMVADVCYFGPYAEAVAAGTSDVAVQPYFRSVNQRYRDLGAGFIAQPINARRVGSFTALSGTANNVGTSHVTRDFDLAPTTHGGLRNQGGAACCSPFRKLIRPTLLEAGIPISMIMQATDATHQAEMQRYLSISEGLGGTNAVVPFDTQLGGITPAGVAGHTGVELTLEATPSATAQRAQTDRQVFKGGSLQMSTLLKGFEVWGPWKDYIVSNWQGICNMPGAASSAGAQGPMGITR